MSGLGLWVRRDMGSLTDPRWTLGCEKTQDPSLGVGKTIWGPCGTCWSWLGFPRPEWTCGPAGNSSLGQSGKGQEEDTPAGSCWEESLGLLAHTAWLSGDPSGNSERLSCGRLEAALVIRGKPSPLFQHNRSQGGEAVMVLRRLL